MRAAMEADWSLQAERIVDQDARTGCSVLLAHISVPSELMISTCTT